MPEENEMIWMKTNRSATVVRAFVQKYPNACVKINRVQETRLLDGWCTKKFLSSLRDFSLSLDGMEILSFHDDSRELFAPMDQLAFVEGLAETKIVRYKILKPSEPKQGLLAKIFGAKA